MLSVGKKVVYPCQGPCLIGAVVRRVVDNRAVTFYQLLILDEGGGKLFVPVDKVNAVGIRPLLKRAEIPGLLERLKRPTSTAEDSRQRARDNSRLLASGSAFDLAEIVESLTELNETKPLSIGERKTLERAKKLLVCEIAEVLRKTREEAERQVDKALRARTNAGPHKQPERQRSLD
ncbi:MAG TPA: CarD family transcriptional regulator [Blastocatellia bacterium]|nr:CarD family transcriptional regulator [Blastocatellia bacterium]